MWGATLLSVLALLSIVGAVLQHDRYHGYPSESVDAPPFPAQFHANISTIAHMVDELREYPPRRRLMEVWYDGVGRRAKAHIHEGFEVDKTFLRRWDTKDEYCYRRDRYPECRRAYLGEPMANFSLPAGWMRLRKGTYQVTTGEGNRIVECLLWVGVSPQGLERVKYYADRNSFTPVRMTTEYAFEGRWDPVMTWTVESLLKDDLEDRMFEVAHPWGQDPKRACKRVSGGWPQLHLFSHYLRI